MANQIYITDLLEDIRSREYMDLIHFISADVIHVLKGFNHPKEDYTYVIYSPNGIDVMLIQYDTWNDYIDKIGNVINWDYITYKESLQMVINLIDNKENK